jgi:beta-glucosidase
MSASPLLGEVVKSEWGFDGLVMSDWWAAHETDGPGAAAIDVLMPGPGGPWGAALVAAVRDGRVPEAAVDAKVERVLGLAARAGALDDGPAVEDPAAPAPDAPEVRALLREAAAASFVLARNGGGLLPLAAASLRRVAVLGPNAAVARTLGGGSATVFPPYTVAPLDGLRSALGDDVVVEHEGGVRAHSRQTVAAPDLLRLPEGDGPGAEIRFLDAGGAELGRERRLGGAFAWHVHYADGIDAASVATVEVRTRVRARAGGEHLIGCSGLGHFTLAVGGGAPQAVELTLPPGADLAAAHMRPPQHAVPVKLGAGEEVAVVLTHTVEGFPFDTPGDVFRLDVEPPAAPDDERLARAVALAEQADVAIVVVGTTEEVESESFDRMSLGLPGRQDELVRRVAAANPRTVVVVNSGAPVLMPWVEDVAAVLVTWFGGQEYGNALADVLVGQVEPGGRLPTTWVADEHGLPPVTPVDGTLTYDEGLFFGHRALGRGLPEPLFPFGHGEGYTRWEYVSFAAPARAGEPARAVVRNAGARRGREVVQVYASWPDSAIERPLHWLVGFAGVEAEAGEEVAVDVEVPLRGLEHWDAETGGWALEGGEVTLSVGRSSTDLRLTAALQID